MREDAGLVTGEAVTLELDLARLASRALALALDVLLQLFVLIGSLVLLAVLAPVDSTAAVLTVLLVVFVLVAVGYPVIFETLSRGRTLGKMALGLRVVRDDGGPIRFRHALVRGLAGVLVDFWGIGLFGAVAFVVSLISPKAKRVGDFLAGTVVVRERAPAAQWSSTVFMPPELAGWAAGLDLSGLSDELALAARQFLGRRLELRPEAAHALGQRLAAEVGQQLAAPLPPGVPPWAYLSAVLAERRSREYARLTGRPVAPPPVYPHQPGFPPNPPPPRTPPDSPFAPPG